MKPDLIKKAINSRLQRNRGRLFWTVMYLIGMFIYTALLFGLSIGAVATLLTFKKSDNYRFTQELLVNWQKNYVTDITMVQANENCPTGYELWQNRAWPGINQGCNCINNNGGFRRLVTPGACSTLQLNSKCEQVAERDAVPLVFWEEEAKVCIQRGDTSFLSSPENCQSGYKRCGQGNVRYCVMDDQACPITDVVLSSVNEMDGYTKVSLTGISTNIFYAREGSIFPISTFKLTEAGYCIFDATNNISPGRLDYVLSKALRRPCVRDENRYITLQSQGEKSLYQNNNLYTLLRSIPGYPLPSNDYTWNLGFVRYFAWNDYCRNGAYSLNETVQKIGLTTLEKIAWITFAITLASVLISGIILPVKYMKEKIKEENIKQVYMKKAKTPPKKDFKKFITSPSYLTDKVAKLLLLPVAFLAIFFTEREKKWFVGAQVNNCADSTTNSYFKVYTNKLDDVLGIYVALIFIWLLMLGADFIYAMYRLIKSDVRISKFFESKIRKEEESVVAVSEDELRGLKSANKSMDQKTAKVTPAE